MHVHAAQSVRSHRINMLSESLFPTARYPGLHGLVPGSPCQGSQLRSKPPMWRRGGASGQLHRRYNDHRRPSSTSSALGSCSAEGP